MCSAAAGVMLDCFKSVCAGLLVVGCEGQAGIQRWTAQQNTAKHQNCCLTNVIVCALPTPVSDQRCRPGAGGDRHCRETLVLMSFLKSYSAAVGRL